MYTPSVISLLCLVVGVLWTTAGFTLLLYSGRSHSRPDFMVGLGLLLGGTLTGLCSTPIAGQGVFPLESIILGLCCLWCFGFGETDEATALQVGDRWPPALAMGTLALVNYLVIDNIGAQPVLWIGGEVRPFELVIGGLFGYLWYRSLSLPETFFSHMPRRHVSCLLLAGLGASVAGLLGGPLADLGRFLILAIGPIPFLAVGIRGKNLARIFAVTLSMGIAFLSLTYAFHMRANRASVENIQLGVVDTALHFSKLHERVQQAIESHEYQEPKLRYGEILATLQHDIHRLETAARDLQRAELRRALRRFVRTFIAHHVCSSDVFEAGLAEQQGRAVRSHQDARLAYARGNTALAALQRELVATYSSIGSDTEQLASFALALLAILALLGTALLRSGAEDSEPTDTFYVHLDPPTPTPKCEKTADQTESAPLR